MQCFAYQLVVYCWVIYHVFAELFFFFFFKLADLVKKCRLNKELKGATELWVCPCRQQHLNNTVTITSIGEFKKYCFMQILIQNILY